MNKDQLIKIFKENDSGKISKFIQDRIEPTVDRLLKRLQAKNN